MRKKLSIALLAFSLALISANLLITRVKGVFFPQKQEVQEEVPFSPFGVIKQDSSTAEPTNNGNRPFMEIKFEDEEPLQTQPKEVLQPILQINLTEEEQNAIESYAKNPKLKSFIEELSGVISKEDIENQNYLQIAFNPQVRAIFTKYSQDQEFREIASQVMKDKNVLELARKVVQEKEVQK